MSWEPVIGCEIHVQLKTRTKMFCRCPNGFGGEPNTQTCPVCLGFPGALPVPNALAVEKTILLGLALDCTIAERAVFHRKNYFYPDLPKGYQISQYDLPLASNGRLTFDTSDGPFSVRIRRAHLEEGHLETSRRIGGVSLRTAATPPRNSARSRRASGSPTENDSDSRSLTSRRPVSSGSSGRLPERSASSRAVSTVVFKGSPFVEASSSAVCGAHGTGAV